MSTAPLSPAPQAPAAPKPAANRELHGAALVAHVEAQIALGLAGSGQDRT